jgi:hypothetical protein
VTAETTDAATADRTTIDAASPPPTGLITTVTPNDTVTPPTCGPAGHVTAREVTEFLRHLAELRVGAHSDDPARRDAFLARKAELFTRIAADPPAPAAPPTSEGRRTP